MNDYRTHQLFERVRNVHLRDARERMWNRLRRIELLRIPYWMRNEYERDVYEDYLNLCVKAGMQL